MDTILVATTCPFCHSTKDVEVDLFGFLDWQDGELIQKAMPELSATDRECLISGICPTCQEKIFS